MYSQRRPWCAAIPALAALALMAHGATIKFDQSQTGDYNLQIHLKNIELYAVFDDSGDDDYPDLPEYTDLPDPPPSKPVPPPAPPSTATTTPKTPPMTATSNYSSSAAGAGSSVASTASPASALLLDSPYSPSNSEKIVQMVEALIASNGNTSDPPAEQPATVAAAAVASSTPSAQQAQSSPVAAASASASSSANNNRKCGPGYFRDPLGRCRRIRKPHLPFLQMVHTPGVIKSFQPQQRTTDEAGAPKN